MSSCVAVPHRYATDLTSDVQVTTHHEELLVQAAGVTQLEGSLGSVKRSLDGLDNALDKLVIIQLNV